MSLNYKCFDTEKKRLSRIEYKYCFDDSSEQ